MNLRAIHNEADYENALAEISGLMEAQPGTPQGDRLDVMATLIEAYEAAHFPIEAPDPIEAILFMMEQKQMCCAHYSMKLTSISVAYQTTMRFDIGQA